MNLANIVFESEFYGREHSGTTLEGKTLAIFRNSEGDLYCAFEDPEIHGVHVISLGSNFFRGFTS
jgi:hypothetical protein